MSDDIIKNKNREIRASVKRVAYQPEYERLNVEPIVRKIDQQDFMSRKAVRLPQQRLPQSGQNEDIIWSQGLAASDKDKISALQEKVRNEIMEKEDQEAFDSIDDKSSFELMNDYNREFRYDDIPNVPSSLIEDDIGLEEEEEDQQEEDQQEEEQQEEQEDNNSFKLSDLQPGNNVLLYNDEVICSGSIEEIKEILSKILLKSDKYLVEDFIVLKRLNIRAGIFIE